MKSYNKNLFNFSILLFTFLAFLSFNSCKTDVEVKNDNIVISYVSEFSNNFESEKMVSKGYKLQKKDLPNLTETGYDFLGWFIKGEKATIDTPITKTTVLLAKWKKIEDNTSPADVTKLTATNSCGDIILNWEDPKDLDLYGIEIIYDLNKPTQLKRSVEPMEHYSILISPNTQSAQISNLIDGVDYKFTVKAVDLSGNKSKGKEVSCTPINKVADVVFTPAAGKIDCGDFVTLNCPTEGASIYYSINQGEIKKYVPGENILIDKDMLIKAYATADQMKQSEEISSKYTLKSFSVTFDSNGHGTTPKTIFGINNGETLSKEQLTPLVADGYEFICWKKQNEIFSEATPVLENITLIAEWKPISYSITYVDAKNLSEGVSNPSSYTTDSEIKLNNPYKIGYTFLGWFDNESFTGEPIKVINKGSIGNKIFYANWNQTVEDKFELALGNELWKYERSHKENGQGFQITQTLQIIDSSKNKIKLYFYLSSCSSYGYYHTSEGFPFTQECTYKETEQGTIEITYKGPNLGYVYTYSILTLENIQERTISLTLEKVTRPTITILNGETQESTSFNCY